MWKLILVKRCKDFENCESRKHRNCKRCNVWNYLYDIKALQKWCKELDKENGKLEGLLEAQVEKMKCCFNCVKGGWNNRVKCIKSGCVNKDKWEIKEK